MGGRYGTEKATTLDGVTRYVGPLEYVVDREFKPGHPPRRLTAEEAAAELNRLRARVAELEPDAARLDYMDKAPGGFIDSWESCDPAGSVREIIDRAAREAGEATWLS